MRSDVEVSVSWSLLHEGHGGRLMGARYAPGGTWPEWWFWGASSCASGFTAVSIARLLAICPQVEPYLGLPPGTRFDVPLAGPGQPQVWRDEGLMTYDPHGRRRQDAPMRTFSRTPPAEPSPVDPNRSADEDLQELTSILNSPEMRSRGVVRGCSDEDIETLRLVVPRVPDAYESFLRLAGREAAGLWIGSDVFFPAVLGHQEELVDCAENDGVDLPKHERLVFFSHQGYIFYWMQLCSGSANPPVWSFKEGQDWPPSLVSHTFTGWLVGAARYDLKLAQGLAFAREERRERDVR